MYILFGERDETVKQLNAYNKLAQKQDKTRFSWKGDPLGIMQEIKKFTRWQMNYA